MPEVMFSGTLRISGMLSSTVLRGLSANIALTRYHAEQFIVNDGVSSFVTNPQGVTNPNFVFCTATQRVRVNIAGHPTFNSAASAGQEFQDFWGFAGSGIVSGPTGLYFSNSSGNSAIITVYLAQ